MEPTSITIALSDSTRGYEISPGRVPLDQLASFAKETQEFLKGSAKDGAPDDTEVSVTSGSLALMAPSVRSPSLLRDILSLQSEPDLSKIDVKRRDIIEKWQTRAQKAGGIVVRISALALGRTIQIDQNSDFRDLGGARLVNVERYVIGEVQDMGGATKPNVHLRLSDGQMLTVKSDRAVIRSETKNLVYQEVQLRIRAKLNLDTNQLTDAVLVSFEEYRPEMSEDAFARLVRNGREAWKGVGDAAEWVRDIRGGH